MFQPLRFRTGEHIVLIESQIVRSVSCTFELNVVVFGLKLTGKSISISISFISENVWKMNKQRNETKRTTLSSKLRVEWQIYNANAAHFTYAYLSIFIFFLSQCLLSNWIAYSSCRWRNVFLTSILQIPHIKYILMLNVRWIFFVFFYSSRSFTPPVQAREFRKYALYVNEYWLSRIIGIL